MTINKQEQWYEEAVKSDQWTSTDFTNGYLAACKKRDEEQREKNARALERLWAIGNRITQDEYETIKSALESV